MDTTELLDSASAPVPGPRAKPGRKPWVFATVAAVAAVSVTAAVTVPRLLTTGAGSPPPLAIGLPLDGADPLTAAVGTQGSPSKSGAAGNGVAAPYKLVGTLPSGPDHAKVQRLDAGPVDRSLVVALATALHLTGAPVPHGQDLWVRSGGAQLTVYGAAGHPWVYVRRDAATCPPMPLDGYGGPTSAVGCVVFDSGPVSSGATTSGGTVTSGTGSASGPAAHTPPKPLPAEQLRAVAGPILDATGLSYGALRDSYGTVLADPIVASRPTSGATTVINADQAGIRTATGWLLGGHDGADYPLRSARAIFDSLQLEPQIRPAMECIVPPDSPSVAPGTPVLPGTSVAPGKSVAPSKPSALGKPSGPADAQGCPMPASQLDVTGASLGLVVAWEKDVPLLVPAWLFDVAPASGYGDQGPIVRVAVATKFLAPAEPITTGPSTSAGSGGASAVAPGTSSGSAEVGSAPAGAKTG